MVTPATICDHVTPHNGDREAFYAGPFQSLCKRHHDAAKAAEERSGYSREMGLDGWPIDDKHPANGGKPQPMRLNLGAYAHPHWLRRSVIPLTIVCGPPASGKTTYVARHRQPRDMVIDLDAIAVGMYGRRAMALDKAQMIAALKARNAMLGDLQFAKVKARHDRAWLIVSEPEADKRQWWADTVQPVQIIVIAAPADVCLSRAASDRTTHRLNAEAGIRKWWASYTPRHGDSLITF